MQTATHPLQLTERPITIQSCSFNTTAHRPSPRYTPKYVLFRPRPHVALCNLTKKLANGMSSLICALLFFHVSKNTVGNFTYMYQSDTKQRSCVPIVFHAIQRKTTSLIFSNIQQMVLPRRIKLQSKNNNGNEISISQHSCT